MAYRDFVGNLLLVAMRILKTNFLDWMAVEIDFVPTMSVLRGPSKMVVMSNEIEVLGVTPQKSLGL